MEYNTQLPKMAIKEYGRNVQLLIEHACTIEDDEIRQGVAEGIIGLMAQLSPQSKNIEDQKIKLWSHLNRIADGNLKVTFPYELNEEPSEVTINAELTYPSEKIRFRHYGKNVESMVEKAIAMEDPEKKKAFAIIIASYMKMVYKNWSRENVSDEVIINDLKNLSKEELIIEPGTYIDSLAKNTTISYHSKPKHNNRGKSKNYRGKSNNKNYKKRNYR